MIFTGSYVIDQDLKLNIFDFGKKILIQRATYFFQFPLSWQGDLALSLYLYKIVSGPSLNIIDVNTNINVSALKTS